MDSSSFSAISRIFLAAVFILILHVFTAQKLFYENRFADTDPHRATDFVKVAEGFGVKALRINTNNDIDSVLKEAFEYQGPVLVDCRISPDSNVLPMIPPGGAHTDIIEKFN